MTLYELINKRDAIGAELSEVSSVVAYLQSAIDSYTEYKTILEGTYGADGNILQDIVDKLNTAKENYREGYQAGDDTISETIDNLVKTPLNEYSTLTSDFMTAVGNTLDQMTSKQSTLQNKISGLETSYRYYQRKIDNGDYDK